MRRSFSEGASQRPPPTRPTLPKRAPGAPPRSGGRRRGVGVRNERTHDAGGRGAEHSKTGGPWPVVQGERSEGRGGQPAE